MYEVNLRLPVHELSVEYADKICFETLEFFNIREKHDIFFAIHEAIINAVEAMKQISMSKGKDYIIITLRLISNEIEVLIKDFGQGIPDKAWEELKQKNFAKALLDESGRGLLFINEFMDEVFAYSEKDLNVIVLKKKIEVDTWKA